MVQQTTPTRRELEAELVNRAWSDEAFMRELRQNPRATIERELARLAPAIGSLPSQLDIKVLEETPTTLYLVIPPKPLANTGELTDDDLDTVAGGGSSLPGNQGNC